MPPGHDAQRCQIIFFKSGFRLISRVAQGFFLFFLKIFCSMFFLYFAQNLFYLTFFFCMKELLFANGDYKTARIPPDPPDKKEPVQNWSNPPEIGSPPEIFFSRQTTFKSARIFEIWWRKPPFGNADDAVDPDSPTLFFAFAVSAL
jgi:hypothetical protein